MPSPGALALPPSLRAPRVDAFQRGQQVVRFSLQLVHPYVRILSNTFLRTVPTLPANQPFLQYHTQGKNAAIRKSSEYDFGMLIFDSSKRLLKSK